MKTLPASGPSTLNSQLSTAADDRFEVGCEGELIDSFVSADGAYEFARWSAEITGTPHEIFDATTHTCLVIVEPLEAA